MLPGETDMYDYCRAIETLYELATRHGLTRQTLLRAIDAEFTHREDEERAHAAKAHDLPAPTLH